MTFIQAFRQKILVAFLGCALTIFTALLPATASAQVTAFKQALAEAASSDAEIATFYRSNNFAPIWTGDSDTDRIRRAELLDVLSNANDHGLPISRYDPAALHALLGAVRSPRDQGLAEIEMTRIFLKYARDVQTGILVPRSVDSSIVREVSYRDRTTYLKEFSAASPRAYLRSLPPATMEYNALMKQKFVLENQIKAGGWGQQVPTSTLEPGQFGNSVALLRNRLIAMKYLDRTNTESYDASMHAAVQKFQRAHGLEPDGVAGASTLAEINKSADNRLRSLLVAMERERWLDRDRGDRHVLVNIPDFSAKIIDHGKITFETRTVVGAAKDGRLTPEFSDVMEFMVINPSWYVPRSIVTKEYLPAMQRNPGASSQLVITDRNGRKISRSAVNFNQYNARNFPFSMHQPPSRSNALGLVKFMFPNKYNIYLHDTPAKNLFSREVRAYSHGCVRLRDPFDFAYALLAKQSDDPVDLFQTRLRTGSETRLTLEKPVPVHIIYRTAYTNERGEMQYRRDIYGRDGRIWDALSRAGVALRAVQG